MVVSQRVDSMAISDLPLVQLASVIRSKNAGPLCLTIDLFFRDAPTYERATLSDTLKVESIAFHYGLKASQIKRFELPEILAIKFSMPRSVCAGNPGDGDVYGAQQHAPLLRLML